LGPRVYEFGPFRLDAEKAVLWRGSDVVPLTPKAPSLLTVLVEAGGDVVPKVELMGRVWPDAAVLEANLGVTVATLRKALGPEEDGRSWIGTVTRRGYRIDGARALDELDRAALARDPFPVLVGMEGPLVSLRGEARFDALVARVHGRV